MIAPPLATSIGTYPHISRVVGGQNLKGICKSVRCPSKRTPASGDQAEHWSHRATWHRLAPGRCIGSTASTAGLLPLGLDPHRELSRGTRRSDLQPMMVVNSGEPFHGTVGVVLQWWAWRFRLRARAPRRHRRHRLRCMMAACRVPAPVGIRLVSAPERDTPKRARAYPRSSPIPPRAVQGIGLSRITNRTARDSRRRRSAPGSARRPSRQ